MTFTETNEILTTEWEYRLVFKLQRVKLCVCCQSQSVVANEAAVYSWYTHTCWSSQQQKCEQRYRWMTLTLTLHAVWVSSLLSRNETFASQNSKPKNRVYRQPKTGFSVLKKNSGLPGFSVSVKTGLETLANKKPSWCWDSQPSVGILGIFFKFSAATLQHGPSRTSLICGPQIV